jgi:type IV pilus assembly protein PilB
VKPLTVRKLIDDHFSLEWCLDNSVAPLETRRDATFGAENTKNSVVVAVGNIAYLGTIGDFIKQRLADAGYNSIFVEKDHESLEAILNQAAGIRRIEGETSDSVSYDEDALAAALQEVAENSEGDISFDFDEGEEAEESEAIDDISAELLGDAIQRSAAQILIKAVKDDASDIHIEPQEDNFRVRLRQDGVLNQFLSIPKGAGVKLTACLKNMARMDIAERRAAQDGRILRFFEGNKLEFRVSVLPGKYGEKTVLRVLKSNPEMLDLDKLIQDKAVLKELRSIITQPFGIILVVGPTGSGKSTTLYSVLSELNTGDNNIVTAEDPIEYSLAGINQVQVLREKNQTFATILRSFLRQDPDVMLIGETRDPETAKASMEAAQTGHLVLSTLHANNSASSVTRLLDMGVPHYLMTSSLLGVLAQRLVRRLCPSCSEEHEASEAEANLLQVEPGTKIRKANVLTQEQRALAKQEGTLCPKCQGKGYKGRLGVYELMPVNKEIKEAIKEGRTSAEIEDAAVQSGMKTLEAYGRQLVLDGLTSIADFQKLVSMVNE